MQLSTADSYKLQTTYSYKLLMNKCNYNARSPQDCLQIFEWRTAQNYIKPNATHSFIAMCNFKPTSTLQVYTNLRKYRPSSYPYPGNLNQHCSAPHPSPTTIFLWAKHSRNRRYDSWGAAPTKEAPMKCTTACGLPTAAAGVKTQQFSTSYHPARDPGADPIASILRGEKWIVSRGTPLVMHAGMSWYGLQALHT